ncbi:MAG: hypothetical protein WHT47_05395 [Hydrogenothermaceae bacterium]
MIGKIVWESFSILLLLYGLYLTYIFIWFSMYRIGIMDMGNSKLTAAVITLSILTFSSVKWFIKKHRQLNKEES